MDKISLIYKFKENKYPIDKYTNKKYKTNFIKRELVEYNRINKTKYNDIYKFLKNGVTPKSFDSIKKAKRMQKKRNDFRNQVKQKYKLENDKLYYKYYIPNKIVKNYNNKYAEDEKKVKIKDNNENNDKDFTFHKNDSEIDLNDFFDLEANNIKKNKVDKKPNEKPKDNISQSDNEILNTKINKNNSNKNSNDINKNINNAQIKENTTLFIKEQENKYFMWKIIPYQSEIIPICTNIHIQLRHAALYKYK